MNHQTNDMPRDFFTSQSTMLIFSYAPAGLGHLRVTDALYHGLPESVTPILLGAQDTSITFFHRLTSIHPLGRELAEWMQRGTPEDLFTAFYRWWLRTHTRLLYEQLTTIVAERLIMPSTVLVIATHFGLAQQIAALKERLFIEKKIRLFLVVQVTDDSPQHLWYVPGANLTVVPSETTRSRLIFYGRENRLSRITIAVSSYPVSPDLIRNLSPKRRQNRLLQLTPNRETPLHVAIPVSGAAVGLSFTETFIVMLSGLSARFRFHIISKDTAYTRPFLEKFRTHTRVELITGTLDHEVVAQYEKLYERETISLEVTKPSEQAFKALIPPHQIGGALLLLSTPVGRQEYDNLDFLRRHDLLPRVSKQQELFENAARGETSNNSTLKESRLWRALRLPDEPVEAARFVYWSLRQGILKEMLECTVKPHPTDEHQHELSSDGVANFWKVVGEQFARWQG